jgi:hypothetical protein
MNELVLTPSRERSVVPALSSMVDRYSSIIAMLFLNVPFRCRWKLQAMSLPVTGKQRANIQGKLMPDLDLGIFASGEVDHARPCHIIDFLPSRLGSCPIYSTTKQKKKKRLLVTMLPVCCSYSGSI